ncbi:MAG: XdhC family protein [Deltaproteobacteria bacterium]|nr:XdhC family protein [Deltaproteobacteria bacterium]
MKEIEGASQVNIFEEILKLLDRRENFALALILSRSGSAPRAVGTRMIILGDGMTVGTIGGGIQEAQVCQLGREVMQTGQAIRRQFVFSDKDAAQLGMICGGQINVLVRRVDGNDAGELAIHQGIDRVFKERKRAWLITGVPTGDGWDSTVKQALLRSDGTSIGELSRDRMELLAKGASIGKPQVLEEDGGLFLVEPLCHQGVAYIFGAGHVGRSIAPLTRFVGFHTVVLDDRAEFASRERFENADQVHVLESFDRAFEDLHVNEDSYVVIVTRGHAYDKTVLAQALRSGAGYIGMIGSRRKRDAIYDALRKEGFPPQELERVHCPVGLDIGAETPEEIGVSIVGEMIRERSERNR